MHPPRISRAVNLSPRNTAAKMTPTIGVKYSEIVVLTTPVFLHAALQRPKLAADANSPRNAMFIQLSELVNRLCAYIVHAVTSVAFRQSRSKPYVSRAQVKKKSAFMVEIAFLIRAGFRQ